MPGDKRSFAIESSNAGVSLNSGRYISSTPSGAARKMFSQLNRASGKNNITLVLRETTKGSKNKNFKYNVKRVNEPTTIERGGETITFNFSTKVKAVK